MGTQTNSYRAFVNKRSSRWKWMAGATVATATGVTASQAGLVTIDLGYSISASGGNNLNADLTGDGHPDLTITRLDYGFGGSAYAKASFARVYLNGIRASGYRDTFFYRNGSIDYIKYGGALGSKGNASGGLTASIPIFFKDLHFNGGTPTEGSLEVTVGTIAEGISGVRLVSLTYTSNSPVQGSIRAVPDQGSTLALLALGAGGILAFRRWRRAQNGLRS